MALAAYGHFSEDADAIVFCKDSPLKMTGWHPGSWISFPYSGSRFDMCARFGI